MQFVLGGDRVRGRIEFQVQGRLSWGHSQRVRERGRVQEMVFGVSRRRTLEAPRLPHDH
jgi:hypothetical protein